MATPAPALPVGDGWSYEVKWDGYRTLALKNGPRVRLYSRNLKDVTDVYPSVARTLGELNAHSALVDGELVAVDEEGRPSFQALHHQSAHAVVYYAFDILQIAGRDLTREPLDARRQQLAAAVKGTRILVSEPLPGTPAQIERAVRELGLEGIVAKRRTSRYEAGRRSGASSTATTAACATSPRTPAAASSPAPCATTTGTRPSRSWAWTGRT